MSTERQSESPSRRSYSFSLSLPHQTAPAAFFIRKFSVQAACGSFGMLIFAERRRARLVFTCDIHRKGFLHNKFSGSSGCVMAVGAARWRERKRGGEISTCKRRKGFSIIGALRNTRCMMWLIFYYLQIKTEKVESTYRRERSWSRLSSQRNRSGCKRNITPNVALWEMKTQPECRHEGRNLTLSRVQDAKRAKPIHIFNLRSTPCRRIESLLEIFQLNYFPAALSLSRGTSGKKEGIFIAATSRLLFPAC